MKTRTLLAAGTALATARSAFTEKPYTDETFVAAKAYQRLAVANVQ